MLDTDGDRSKMFTEVGHNKTIFTLRKSSVLRYRAHQTSFILFLQRYWRVLIFLSIE